MLNLIFWLILVALGSNYHKIMGLNFFTSKSTKTVGGADPIFTSYIICTGFNCIAYFINPAENKLDLSWEYIYVFVVDYYSGGS